MLGTIAATLFVGLLFVALFLAIVNLLMPKGKHDPNHTGISVGGRDIICPKCHSANCQYDYQTVQHTYEKTTYRVRPLHPFKPVKSKTYEVPTYNSTIKQYRCMDCGWIFK